MKKTTLFVLLLSSSLLMNAQSKVGYINANELLEAMPEAKKANEELNEYQAALQQQNNDLLKELAEKDSLFVKDSAKMTNAIKTFRRNELIKLYQEVQGFSQRVQEELTKKQEGLLTPIRKKAMDVLKEVAQANGYTHVIDNSGGMLLIALDGDNLLTKVLAKMGIKK